MDFTLVSTHWHFTFISFSSLMRFPVFRVVVLSDGFRGDGWNRRFFFLTMTNSTTTTTSTTSTAADNDGEDWKGSTFTHANIIYSTHHIQQCLEEGGEDAQHVLPTNMPECQMNFPENVKYERMNPTPRPPIPHIPTKKHTHTPKYYVYILYIYMVYVHTSGGTIHSH